MWIRKKIIWISLSVAVAMTNAFAVQLSASSGQVLIYPYYTVNGGYDTYVSVVNTKATGKALKVRFLEGKNGREVMGFNLYLAPNDVWATAITSASTVGARLVINDKSCTSPVLTQDQAINFTNLNYTGSDGDGDDTSLARTREGHIEIIEMGEIAPISIPDSSGNGFILFSNAVTTLRSSREGVATNDCAAVTKAWSGVFRDSSLPDRGLTNPTGGLTGTATVINVAEGTSYSYDALMLAGFRDRPMHTNYGDATPNLSSASPKTSTILLDDRVIVSTWNNNGQNAADPVSAVLMHAAVTNEFVIDPAIGAGTDWVLAFPTKKFYVNVVAPRVPLPPPDFVPFPPRPPAPVTALSRDVVPLVENSFKVFKATSTTFERPFTSTFWRGGACETFLGKMYDRQERFLVQFGGIPPPSPASELCFSVNTGTINRSRVLKSPDREAAPLGPSVGVGGLGTSVHDSVSSWTPFVAGWLKISFPQQFPCCNITINIRDGNGIATRQITDDAGIKYLGLPAVGFAVQKYVNGNVNGALSNYGGLFTHKYERQVQ